MRFLEGPEPNSFGLSHQLVEFEMAKIYDHLVQELYLPHINPLNCIVYLLSLYISYKSSWEKLLKNLCNHVRNSHDRSVFQSIGITRRTLMLINLRAQRAKQS